MIKWQADHDDPTSIDDLTARNVTLLRLERMNDDHYWLMFEIDGVQHHIDIHVKPRCKRKMIAFNRGDLPPARKP